MPGGWGGGDVWILRNPKATALSGSLGSKSPPPTAPLAPGEGQWQMNLHCGAGKGLLHVEDLALGTGLMATDANKQIYSYLDRGWSLGLGVKVGERSGGSRSGALYLLNPQGVESQVAACLGDGGLGGLPRGSRFHLSFISAVDEIQTVKFTSSAENSKLR